MKIACFSLVAVLSICTLAAAQSPDEIVRSPKVRKALEFIRTIEPETIEIACQALGAWVEGGFGSDGVPEVVFTEPVEDGDDPSVACLKRFLHALIIAASLDVPVRTGDAGSEPVWADKVGGIKR